MTKIRFPHLANFPGCPVVYNEAKRAEIAVSQADQQNFCVDVDQPDSALRSSVAEQSCGCESGLAENWRPMRRSSLQAISDILHSARMAVSTTCGARLLIGLHQRT